MARKRYSPKDRALGKDGSDISESEDFEASVPLGEDEVAESADKDPTDSRSADRNAPDRTQHPVEFSEDDLKKLGTEFSDAIRGELGQRSGREQDWLRYIRLYNAQPKSPEKSYPLQGASNVVVPLARIYCDTLIAREMQAMFSISPLWMATELNRKFSKAVKPMERWLDWIQENIWSERRIVKSLVQETVKLGTSVLYQGWCDETRYRYDDKARQTVPAGRKYGPDPQWVALEDFVIPQGYAQVKDAPYVAMRLRFSWDRLRQLAFSNYIENLDQLRGETSPMTELQRERQDPTSGDFTTEDRFALYELWSVWFSRDFDGDGWPEEYVMLLHLDTASIHRLKANPFPSQMRPFVVTKFIDQEGEFYGIGIPEMIEQLQEESSTIHNQRRDRAHLSNIVMWIAGAANHGITDTVRPASGKVMKVVDITQIKELRPASNVTIDAYEESFVNALADRTVGVSELNDGRMTSPVGRAAATTVMALLQEGARRFDLYTAEMRAALSEQAHQIAELYQTYGLPDAEMSGSPEQVLDEEDAMRVREILQIQDDLRNFMAIKLNVSTQAVNREVEKKSNMELYQFMVQHATTISQFATGVVNPQSPPPIKAYFEKIIETLNRAADKLLTSYSAFDLDGALASEVLFQMGQPNPAQPQITDQGMMPQQGQPQPQQIPGAPPNGNGSIIPQ